MNSEKKNTLFVLIVCSFSSVSVFVLLIFLFLFHFIHSFEFNIYFLAYHDHFNWKSSKRLNDNYNNTCSIHFKSKNTFVYEYFKYFVRFMIQRWFVIFFCTCVHRADYERIHLFKIRYNCLCSLFKLTVLHLYWNFKENKKALAK